MTYTSLPRTTDVFKIILKWIGADTRESRKNFKDLFRHVRLDFVSRDYFMNQVSTNHFLKQNEVCLNNVTRTLECMRNPMRFPMVTSKPPRTVVACETAGGSIWAYLPEDDVWYQLPDKISALTHFYHMRFILDYRPRWLLSIRNKLFAMDFSKSWENDFPCCDPLLDIWTLFPNINWFRERHFQSCGKAIVVTVVQENIYVLPADTTILLKYNVYSQSWQTVGHFDWGSTADVCVVPSDKYLYAIGGQLISKHRKCLAEAGNFDTSTKKWETTSQQTSETF